MATTYTINLENNSGATLSPALFQTIADGSAAETYPLVWVKKTIATGVTGTFSWEVDWSLGWGTTPTSIGSGVLFSAVSTPASVTPQVNTENSISITYASGAFVQNAPETDPSITSNGQIAATTDTTFTTADATNHYVAVYMKVIGDSGSSDSNPILVTQLYPNTDYTFITHPTYFISANVGQEIKTAVTLEFVAGLKSVSFSDGVTTMNCMIDPSLTVSCTPASSDMISLLDLDDVCSPYVANCTTTTADCGTSDASNAGMLLGAVISLATTAFLAN